MLFLFLMVDGADTSVGILHVLRPLFLLFADPDTKLLLCVGYLSGLDQRGGLGGGGEGNAGGLVMAKRHLLQLLYRAHSRPLARRRGPGRGRGGSNAPGRPWAGHAPHQA